jgi:hypothetical protein
MSRAPAATDFHVDVDGVGQFVFAKRTMRDELRIAAEYSRLTEGVETPTNFLATVAGWISTLKALTVEAPHGWDLDEMDPFDDETHEKILKVYASLRVKEGSFRKGKNPPSEGSGPGSVEAT